MDCPVELEILIKREFDRFRGRTLGTIESFGLPPVQEEGAKTTIKSLSYDAQAHIVDAIELFLADA